MLPAELIALRVRSDFEIPLCSRQNPGWTEFTRLSDRKRRVERRDHSYLGDSRAAPAA